MEGHTRNAVEDQGQLEMVLTQDDGRGGRGNEGNVPSPECNQAMNKLSTCCIFWNMVQTTLFPATGLRSEHVD